MTDSGRSSVLGVISGSCLFVSVPSNQSEPLNPRSLSSPSLLFSWCWRPWKQERSLKLGCIEASNPPSYILSFLLITNNRNFWKFLGLHRNIWKTLPNHTFMTFLFPDSANHHIDHHISHTVASRPMMAPSLLMKEKPQHRVQCTEPGNSATLQEQPLVGCEAVPSILIQKQQSRNSRLNIIQLIQNMSSAPCFELLWICAKIAIKRWLKVRCWAEIPQERKEKCLSITLAHQHWRNPARSVRCKITTWKKMVPGAFCSWFSTRYLAWKNQAEYFVLSLFLRRGQRQNKAKS